MNYFNFRQEISPFHGNPQHFQSGNTFSFPAAFKYAYLPVVADCVDLGRLRFPQRLTSEAGHAVLFDRRGASKKGKLIAGLPLNKADGCLGLGGLSCVLRHISSLVGGEAPSSSSE